MYKLYYLFLTFLISDTPDLFGQVELIVLGTVQDAGSPQIGCYQKCCIHLWSNPDPTRKISSLGIIDHGEQKSFLIDATPDIKTQIDLLQQSAQLTSNLPDAILLTHAHMGHYSGLLQLGKEAINAHGVVVAAMPRMMTFLSNNGPWDQLVHTQNMVIMEIRADTSYQFTPNLSIVPMIVPHRDEYSETVGYRIIGPHKSALFIPDIDKWHLWDSSITAEIEQVDYAFLDATFYDGAELGGRDMSTIPHPTVEESMELFHSLPPASKSKIYFIHFNHTNPLLDSKSEAYQELISQGYHIAQYGQKFGL